MGSTLRLITWYRGEIPEIPTVLPAPVPKMNAMPRWEAAVTQRARLNCFDWLQGLLYLSQYDIACNSYKICLPWGKHHGTCRPTTYQREPESCSKHTTAPDLLDMGQSLKYRWMDLKTANANARALELHQHSTQPFFSQRKTQLRSACGNLIEGATTQVCTCSGACKIPPIFL